MSRWLTAVLQTRSDWGISSFLSPLVRWPTELPLVPLVDIAEFIRVPGAQVAAGTAAISPSGLSDQFGALESHETDRARAAWRVSKTSLRTGDILVPVRAPRRAVLVLPDHAGLAFVGPWVALRPDPAVMHAAVLWGLLSSRTGCQLREDLANSVDSSNVLGQLSVPLIPLDAQEKTLRRLNEAAAAQVVLDSSAPRSWWRTGRVEGGSWRVLLSFKDPIDVRNGMPLRELAEVRRGARSVEGERGRPAPGLLPVLTNQCVHRGTAPESWAYPASAAVVAQPGDLVVSLVRHDAPVFLSAEPQLVRGELAVISPLASVDPQWLRDALDVPQSRALRSALSEGAVLELLNVQRLADLPVQDPPPSSVRESREPLDVALERVLWG